MSAAAPPLTRTDFDAQSAEFYELFYQLSHLARHTLQSSLAVHNLTLPQFTAMKAVASRGNCITVTALAEATHQVMPTITNILNRLEERGLVVRRRSPSDRRTQLVSLTPAAEAILAGFTDRTRSQLTEALASLNPGERDTLLHTIRLLTARFSAVLAAPTAQDSSID